MTLFILSQLSSVQKNKKLASLTRKPPPLATSRPALRFEVAAVLEAAVGGARRRVGEQGGGAAARRRGGGWSGDFWA